MKLFKILIFIFFISASILAQESKRGNIWMLGGAIAPSYPKFGVDFNNGTADTFSVYRQMNFFLTNASICDTNGQMLFYTNGNFVSNKMDTIMSGSNGFNPGYENSSTYPYGSGLSQGALVLPIPFDSNKYLIFHMSADTFTVSPYHYYRPLNLMKSVIDMTLDSGRGAFTAIKNEVILNDTLVIGRLSACQHANGRDWWILAHELWSDQFYEFLLTPDSLRLFQTQHIGSVITHRMDVLGAAVFSQNGDNFAYINSDTTLNIYQFDRCTGLLSSPVYVYFLDTLNVGTIGCAFSPSGRYLYVSNNYHIYQLDIYASDVAASKTIVAYYDGYLSPMGTRTTFNFMKLAPDNKIYISTYEGSNIFHVINDPDNLGLSCNLTQHSFTLPSYNAFSMPNTPNFGLGPVWGSVCDSLSSGIEEVNETEEYLKIYPNPASDNISITSNIENRIHSELSIINSMGQHIFSKSIHSVEDLNNIDVRYFADGVYSCRLIDDKNKIRSVSFNVLH